MFGKQSKLSNLSRVLIAIVAVVVLQGATPDPKLFSVSLSGEFYLSVRFSPDQLAIARSYISDIALGCASSIVSTTSVLPARPEKPLSKVFRIVSVRNVSENNRFLWPVRGGISSGYGMRRHPITRRASFHAGIDILAHSGTPVIAPVDGLVTSACRVGAMGRLVKMRSLSGLILYFGHLSAYRCAKGQRIRRGQVVGLVGSTGRTTGPHLHFSVARAGRYLNPLTLLSSR